jgi:hypothetical protein
MSAMIFAEREQKKSQLVALQKQAALWIANLRESDRATVEDARARIEQSTDRSATCDELWREELRKSGIVWSARDREGFRVFLACEKLAVELEQP